MVTELDVLGIVGERLTARNISFMLTRSFAMAHYVTPRMTRDLDIVVALTSADVPELVSAFAADEFARRREAAMGAVRTWIVSREDLILSKLVWARDGASELQMRDVRQLLDGPIDRQYLRQWAKVLEIEVLLEDAMQ